VVEGVRCGAAVGWGAGTRPEGVRTVCTGGATGVGGQVIATLDVVRTAEEVARPPAASGDEELDLTWRRDDEQDGSRARARSVWPVLAVAACGSSLIALFAGFRWVVSSESLTPLAEATGMLPILLLHNVADSFEKRRIHWPSAGSLKLLTSASLRNWYRTAGVYAALLVIVTELAGLVVARLLGISPLCQ